MGKFISEWTTHESPEQEACAYSRGSPFYPGFSRQQHYIPIAHNITHDICPIRGTFASWHENKGLAWQYIDTFCLLCRDSEPKLMEGKLLQNEEMYQKRKIGRSSNVFVVVIFQVWSVKASVLVKYLDIIHRALMDFVRTV